MARKVKGTRTVNRIISRARRKIDIQPDFSPGEMNSKEKMLLKKITKTNTTNKKSGDAKLNFVINAQHTNRMNRYKNKNDDLNLKRYITFYGIKPKMNRWK